MFIYVTQETSVSKYFVLSAAPAFRGRKQHIYVAANQVTTLTSLQSTTSTKKVRTFALFSLFESSICVDV
jgi:hypothetical protein